MERLEEMPVEFADVLRGVGARKRYVVRFAERMALGTPYTEVVGAVKGLVSQLVARAGTVVLVVDGSGVGVPVAEMMREVGMGCGLYPVVITSGGASGGSGLGSVSRVELVTKMQMMAERGELEFAEGCGERLRWELLHLRLEGGSGGKRESDDLAITLALACWKARVR